MKKLILDYSKWRCGDNGENKLGDGNTALLNDKGFMCCLGQFGLQLKPDLKEDDILGKGEPQDAKIEIPLLSYMESDGYDGSCYYQSTKLTDKAIKINDATDTTPVEKIYLLSKLFLQYECEIEVINLPKETEL